MGRKYYCDYCEKRIQNDVNNVKKHNEGLPHLKAKADYYERFKAPEQIVAEARTKTECRSLKDGKECMFGALCRFCHYTPQQLRHLQQQVDTQKLIQVARSERLYRRMRHVRKRLDKFCSKRLKKQRTDKEQTLSVSLQAIDFENDPKQAAWGCR
ncbi:zinc finger matrin-type protein 5 [Anopheles aquasalis]|uniref:zinc finger matrin-type protein 5 n=1 Tax=Anopheles aquasalis TaxID=42839 RepID=UPI00215A1571|nr:zinc finger matrin-type protein 5 [Anopheles aquasalis]